MYLCNSCTQSLTISYNFLEQVKQSDKKFQSTIDDSLNVTSDSTLDEFVENSQIRKPQLTNDLKLIATMQNDDIIDYEYVELNELVNENSALDEDELYLMNVEESENIKRKEITKKPVAKQQSKYEQLALSNFTIDNSLPLTIDYDKDGDDEKYENTSNSNKKSKVKNIEIIASNYCNVAVPQYTITTSTQSDDEDDASKACADSSEETSPRYKVKTMNISAVKLVSVQKTDLQNLEKICSIQPDDNSSIFKCKHCPKAFATAYHLMMHTRKAHVCQHCIMAFEKTTDLYKHIKEVHSTFSCLMCKKVFRSNSNLRHHMRTHHSVFLPAHVSLINIDDRTDFK